MTQVKQITLRKGQEIKFLDYTIKNCLNNDGIVLFKDTENAADYECHLGNYGTDGNPDAAMIAAIIHFMLARPETFAATMFYRSIGRGGQMHEFPLFRDAVKKAGLTMPPEITGSNDGNWQVRFKGKDLKYRNEEDDDIVKNSELLDTVKNLSHVMTMSESAFHIANIEAKKVIKKYDK